MISSSADSSVLLQNNLGIAAEKLRRADSRVARSRGLSQAVFVAAMTAGVIAVEVAVIRLFDAPSGIAWSTVGLGLAAAGIIFAISISDRLKVDWTEVAERLDLAAKSKNAIATALDLSREPDASPIVQLAVADGISAARTLAAIEPVVAVPAAQNRSGWAWLAGGILAVVLALFVPALPPAHPELLASGVALGLSPAKTQPAQDPHPTTLLAKKKESVDASSPSTPMQSLGSASPAKQNAGSSSSAAASASAASPGESSAAKAKTGEPGASPPNPPQAASTGNPQAGSPKTTDNVNKTMAMAAFGAASADASQSQSTPPQSGAASDADQSNSSSAKDDKSSGNDQSNGAGDNKSEKSQPGDGSGDGEGKEGKDGKGQGSGHSQQSSDQAGGNGHGSGQNAPKKSRGVAPLMLGSRQPDLLHGRQLPGPDERTKLQIPPQPTPETPASASQATARQTNESAVDVYHIPPDAQKAVQQYFEQFHEDPATPAASD